MPSNNEKGHVKNMNNLENLIKICTEFGSKYNPSKPSLQLANLAQLFTNASAEITNVNQKLIDYNNTVHSRQLKFDNLRKVATRIIYAMEITDANDMTIENAKSLKKKIYGVRIGKVAEAKPLTDGAAAPEKKLNSTAQTSFGQLVDHFSKLILIVQSEPTYNPNENDLKPTELTTFLNELVTANTNALEAEAALRTARQKRNELFYTGDHNLIDSVVDAKKYVKSIFGLNTVEYKSLTSIQVRKPTR